MNRKERRRIERETKKDPIYTLKQSDLKNKIAQRIEPEIKQVYVDATMATMAAMILALRDVYGFGAGRISKVLEKTSYTSQCVEAGTVTPEDLIKQIKDEIGIELQ